MFTTCPKCSLKLVVTAADLRVAQGYVRCGRCSNVFNALAAISDEQQAVLAREPAQAHREPPAPSEGNPGASTAPQAPAPAPSSGQTPAPPRAEEPIPDEALEFDPSSTDVSEVFVEPADDDPTGTFESIVLHGDELEESPSSETEDEARVSENSETHELEIDLEALIGVTSPLPRPEIAKQPPPEPSERPSHGRTPPEVPAPPRPLAREPVPATPAPPRPVAREPEARAEVPAAELVPVESEQALHQEEESGDDAHLNIERMLRIGSVALALLLALQIVNHERAELAGVSWLRAPLTAVYSALGMPLAPHWNVRAYEVRQLGAVAGNPGALTVRASVRNTAPRDQPLPLLRVTMQDRFGNRVAARDVPPSAYLPAGSSNRADLAAGQRVDAEIAFADPGPNAVGFEIDACLKLASGRVACANDAPARATR
ncbi:MAG TPA: zinc-ribbon and DUF3426 domain-containing protein [Steroidobacteraceae bacterium]|jgi:predicted Zn finger-like uncharacterized protein